MNLKFSTNEEARALFFEIISTGKKHKHYDKTVEIAKKGIRYMCNQITVKDLKQWRNENEKQLEARLRVTHCQVAQKLNRTQTPLEELGKNEPIEVNPTRKSGKEEDFLAFQTCVDTFNGRTKNGLKSWVFDETKDLIFSDPNAWKFMLVNEYDQLKPHIYYSENVINYNINDQDHDFFIGRAAVDFPNCDKYKDLKKYIMYTKLGTQFELSEHPNDEKFEVPAGYQVLTIKSEKTKDGNELSCELKYINGVPLPVPINAGMTGKWLFREFPNSITCIPGKVVGYTKHKEYPEIYTYFWHKAETTVEQYIDWSSEDQLNTKIHGLLQLYNYVPSCKYTSTMEDPSDKKNTLPVMCVKGTLKGGGHNLGKCEACDGTGNDVKMTTQEVITFAYTNNMRNEDIIDLKKLFAYKEVPVEAMQNMRDRTIECADNIHKDVYGMNILALSETSVMKTATQVNAIQGSGRNVISRFGEQVSDLIMFFVNIAAKYKAVEFEEPYSHKWSSDFEVRSNDQIIAYIEKLKNAGAPSMLIEHAYMSLLKKDTHNDNAMIKKFIFLQHWKPFKSKSEQERAAFTSYNSDNFYSILYCHYDSIMNEVFDRDSDICNRDRKTQKALIETVVNEFKAMFSEPVRNKRVGVEQN